MKTGKEILIEYKNQSAIFHGSLATFKTLEELIDEALKIAKVEGEIAGLERTLKMVRNSNIV